MEQFEELSTGFRDKFDFSPGEIEYIVTFADEDMLMVEYPEKLTLDVGFYQGILGIKIIWDNNWQTPVAEYLCRTEHDLEKLMNMALEQIKTEMEQKRFSYYGPLWETMKISCL
ncbi:MAG: hypothetical protein ACI4JF_08785 [Oscillospiraceae bacterium]